MANNIEDELNNIFSLHNLKYSKSIIKEENWNAVWESNFEPVRVGDFVGIRANFHPSFDPKVQYEIQITPKMSFGTGHHATTFTVMQLMENLDFRGKSVYDFGTGTGILAILAEMLGASEVLAVDNDPWCIENSEENLQANGSSKITIQLVDAAFQPRDFDIIIANVNRHIIEANLEALTQVSNSNSTLILSGLLIEDQYDIISLAHKNNWQFIQSQPLDGWVSLLFNKA
jgi:ribosomal protein L11 methyltransferase